MISVLAFGFCLGLTYTAVIDALLLGRSRLAIAVYGISAAINIPGAGKAFGWWSL